MEFIQTDKAPEAVGPYSQAVRVGEWLYCSGQISIDPKTNSVAHYDGDVAQQTVQVLSNLSAVLVAAGGSFTDIVKVNVYVKNMNDFAEVNRVYSEAFGAHRPARACVEVSRLPKDVLVEIDAVACIAKVNVSC